MADKQPVQADEGKPKTAHDDPTKLAGGGESGGGAYPNPHKGGGKPFDGGQSEKSYEGPDNPNATTD